MPDHVHVLVSLYEGNLPSLMKSFKQLTGFHFKRETGQELWQKSYYDHIVPKEEDLADIALYIAANPVRRGLVQEWEDYPLTGGSLLARGVDPAPAPGDLKVAATFPSRPSV
jgi:REP element-mobilizing transposase RayT